MILKASSCCIFEKPPSFFFAPLLDLTVFSAYGRLYKLKIEKNTRKLTEIAINFVKIRYNRPQL